MGNSIRLHQSGASVADIHLSNRATDSFILMLVLSRTALARTEEEKDLIVFIAEHDQMQYGDGMVGFSFNEMPWEKDLFEQQQQFMIRVVDGAHAKRTGTRLKTLPRLFRCSSPSWIS